MLSPRDQIVESIEVWPKADGNPRNGAPDDESVPHVIPLFPRANGGGFEVRRVACNSAAVCRNSASNSRGSMPSAFITALVVESASISTKRDSRHCELMGYPSS